MSVFLSRNVYFVRYTLYRVYLTRYTYKAHI